MRSSKERIRTVRLLVMVANNPDPVRFFSGPASTRLENCHGHNFHVFGVHYFMFVGKEMDSSVSRLFDTLGSDTIFELKNQQDHTPFRRLAEAVAKSPSSRRLRGRL